MPNAPKFSYWLYADNRPVDRDSDIWTRVLPANRNQLGDRNAAAEDRPIYHKDYFLSTRQFLESNHCEKLVRAIASGYKQEIAATDIDEVRIRLVKHGEFYHPAMVEVVAAGSLLLFCFKCGAKRCGKSLLEYGTPCAETFHAGVSTKRSSGNIWLRNCFGRNRPA